MISKRTKRTLCENVDIKWKQIKENKDKDREQEHKCRIQKCIF